MLNSTQTTKKTEKQQLLFGHLAKFAKKANQIGKKKRTVAGM
jgi:hypothetical protein